MRNFIVTIREGSKKDTRFMVSASSVEEAAKKVMPKIQRGAKAVRTTGEFGLGGMFQGYKQLRGGGATSSGPSFHVMG